MLAQEPRFRCARRDSGSACHAGVVRAALLECARRFQEVRAMLDSARGASGVHAALREYLSFSLILTGL